MVESVDKLRLLLTLNLSAEESGQVGKFCDSEARILLMSKGFPDKTKRGAK
jgi:hypothetical protein